VYSAAYASPPPADAFARLRRRLSAGALGLDAFPRPLPVAAGGRERGAAARPGRAEARRLGRQPQLGQAAGAGALARTAGVDPDRLRLRARREARPSRGGRDPRRRLARRAARRGAREGVGVRYASLLLRAFFPSPGAVGAPTCKYHPSCSQYASEALR